MGDKFINEIYYALQQANQDSVKRDKSKLYIYDNYNVKCFSSHPMSKVTEAPARLLNALIHGLNEQKDTFLNNKDRCLTNPTVVILPRHIFVIPYWDIVKHIGHYKYSVSIIAEKILHWLVSNMSQAIEARKDDLARVKARATVSSEPKFIWIAMVNSIDCYDKALSVCNKFNAILEDILADFKGHYIANISKQMVDTAFYTSTSLSGTGATRFWLELNKTLADFDAHDISLRPLKSTDQPQHSYKMPPPPPQGGGGTANFANTRQGHHRDLTRPSRNHCARDHGRMTHNRRQNIHGICRENSNRLSNPEARRTIRKNLSQFY